MASEEAKVASEEAKTGDASTPLILGMGNPLLDISAEVPHSLLKKYNLKLDSAILAGDEHQPLYAEMVESFDVDYIAGGATQNTIRVAQWMLGDKGRTAYIGAIGSDKFGEQLKKAAAADGVDTHYLVNSEVATGTCAVLIENTERSLVANLAAANTYKKEHFDSDECKAVLNDASIVYSSGFFLTVSADSMLAAGAHCAETGKVYAVNLAAPFIAQFFTDPLAKVIRFADYVFGNESEAAAWATANGMEGASIEDVAAAIAKLPKENGARGRVVAITRGAEPAVVCVNGEVKHFPCVKLAKEAIVDQNGAGDGFVGGFLTELARGKSLEDCVRCGQFAARVVLCASGVTLPKTKPDYDWEA